MSRLPASLDAPPSGRRRPVWFDAAAYGRAKLLGGEEVPWPAPAELSSFVAKLGGMFRPDAILADVGDLLAQQAAASPQLRAAMAARNRPGYALRTLLGDEQARSIAAEAVRVLAATGGPVPLVLTMPAPGRWLAAAARQAIGVGGDPAQSDAGQAETAAIYIADFLRLFADARVDGVLLDEGGVPAGGLINPEAYRPVLNVADHYGWSVLILAGSAAAWPFGPVSGVSVWLGSDPPIAPDGPAGPSGRWGAVAGPEFWDGADPPAGADLVFAAVPAEADPDAVMKRVRALPLSVPASATYDPSMDRLNPSAADSASEVSAALTPRTAEMSADIYELIVREIPPLRSDRRVLTLLEASVAENVATMLHVIQHGIDLDNVHAPVAAQEYARRLAQRDVPVSALLRAYRIGSARFEDWCLQELGRRTDNAAVVSTAGLRIAGLTAAYIDKVSEEVLAAYELEKENWVRNLSVTRAARVRALLRNEQVDVSSAEAILGYRLRQYHLGVVTWITGASAGDNTLGLLEHATAEVAAEAGCNGRPIFVPQDEASAWAWLPLGARRDSVPAGIGIAPPGSGDTIRFALGTPAAGVAGFRRTNQQALGAQAVALAAGTAGQRVTSYADVAPLALMSGSIELLQAWVLETLGTLATDDEHHARLRATLRVFLEENGSYKATAERLLLHKNSVQYRVRKAEEGLGHPVMQDRLQVELALLASQWLGAAVLRPAADPEARPARPEA